jgi:short-subunit dehydrogenase
MAYNFADKTAIITGASSGIGLEIARLLHQHGCHVTLVARREELLKSEVAAMNSIRSSSARAFPCSLLAPDRSRIEDLVRSESFDILIANAGRGSFGYFESLSIDSEMEMIELNIVAPARLMHAAIPAMKIKRAGVILTVSSIAAFQPLPYMSTYSATKAFNLNHAIALRQELKSFGVRVISLCPGPTLTEYHTRAGIPAGWSAAYHDHAQRVAEGAIYAIQHNLDWITPGFRSGWLARLARIMPLSISTMIAERILAQAVRAIPQEA